MPRDARDAVKRPIPHLEIGRSRKGLIQAQERLQKGATEVTGGFGFISTDFFMRGYSWTGSDVPAMHTSCGVNGLYRIHFRKK